jgi:ATP synthase protein I
VNEIMRISTRVALYIASAGFLVWAVMPASRTIAAGILLGLAASWFNMYLLRRRVEQVTEMSARGTPRKMGAGLASRLATVLLVVMIAYRFSMYFNLSAALGACFIMPFVALVVASVLNRRNLNGKG